MQKGRVASVVVPVSGSLTDKIEGRAEPASERSGLLAGTTKAGRAAAAVWGCRFWLFYGLYAPVASTTCTPFTGRGHLSLP